MSGQCPSTVGTKSSRKARAAHAAVGVSPTGKAYWRSLDDLADTSEFRDWLEQEFPAGASRLLEGSRRTFLKLMGASFALAGAATIPGCRRPDHKIMPYSKTVPEETIPGKARYYATSMSIPGGGAEGLLVETHEGRPTKVEGNPLHSINRGKSSIFAQAAILGIYDPDRLKDPVFIDSGPDARSWEDFGAWSKKHFESLKAAQGKGVAFIVDKTSSPSMEAMKKRVTAAWPQAMWAWYSPTDASAPVQGARAAFGRPVRENLHLEKAKVIVCLDRDLCGHEPGSLVNSRGFAATRRVLAHDGGMSRLYSIESDFTTTGGKADHRVRLAPSQIPAFAAALAQALDVPVSGAMAAGAGVDKKIVDAIAADLKMDESKKSRDGAVVVLAGPSQPAAVHALCHAMNSALGAIGKTVTYTDLTEAESADSFEQLGAICQAMEAKAVDTVVVIGANPVYNAPAELKFKDAFAKVAMRITASVDHNETVAASNWRLPMAHFLEAWGDTRAADGTIAPVQPMIAPLFGARSDLEILATVLGDEKPDGHAIVRAAWQPVLNAGAPDSPAFEKRWRRALHDGVLATSAPEAAKVTLNAAEVAKLVSAMPAAGAPPAQGSMDVVFVQGNVGDGRYANCGWLQELPHTGTRMVWDNAALVSPATAEALGLTPEKETKEKRHARVANLTVGGRSMRIPVWVLPGLPEHTIVLPLGYGRTEVGLVGREVGFNTYALRGTGPTTALRGATLTAVDDGERWYKISSTQSHGSMEGRAIVREVDLAAWHKHGSEKETVADAYGRKKSLNFGEMLGELSHAPANVSIYTNPLNASPADAAPGTLNERGIPAPHAKGPQWGMSIDLSTCTGCNVCTIACQAENNIPIVGKIEVNKGREMSWIRVDRYFLGDNPADDSLTMVHQPVACVHCENAPCETVCPVNATVHGPEGMNYMVYNRCIGTRYCANNCPYKVRRFNFFDYGVKKFNGDYVGKDLMPAGGPKNVNLIPPRLREKVDEITKLGNNPNVTVRSRGVMEKCSYCVQRVNEARIESKLTDVHGFIPDGAVQAACQQACPTNSIYFGDILDTDTEYTSEEGVKRKGSIAHAMREHGRSYLLLGFLNTRPRTTYMVGLRNPNPALRTPNDTPFEHHHHHDHDDHDHSGDAPHAGLPSGVKVRLPVLGALA